jgi:hypothetical protein
MFQFSVLLAGFHVYVLMRQNFNKEIHYDLLLALELSGALVLLFV